MDPEQAEQFKKMRALFENPEQAKAYMFLNPEDKVIEQKIKGFELNPQETLLKEGEALLTPYQLQCY